MKTAIIFVLGILTTIQASGHVSVNKKVQYFLEKTAISEETSHRSGLLDEKTMTFQKRNINNERIIGNDTVFSNAIDSRRWKNSFANEYIVIEKEPNDKKSNTLVKELSGSGLSRYTYDTNENKAEISTPDYSFGLMRQKFEDGGTLLSEEQLKANAQSFIDTYLRKYSKYLEYDRTDLTKINKKDIIKAKVCFRRIFRGGIILDGVSYVNVIVDPFGNIVCVDLKWPEFKEIDSPKAAISINKAMKIATEIYSQTDTAQSDVEKTAIDEIEITGVAHAWHKIQKNDSLIISPCYSFTSTGHLRNGTICNDKINIPVIKDYYLNKKM